MQKRTHSLYLLLQAIPCHLTWLMAYLLLALLCGEGAQAQYPIGNDALSEFEDWPLYREGVLCAQLSSADPQGGDNDGAGFLYQEDSLYVIFDQDGPGCVYRIWIRNTPSAPGRTIKLFFDNELFPSISVPVGTIFSGLYQNFLAPLVGNGAVSSGGNYCYLPLPFAQHLKIALVNVVLPNQITYQLYPPGTAIASFTNEVPDSLIAQWQNAGADPKSTSGNQTASGNLVLPSNQTHTLFSRTGAGSIAGIRLTPSPTTLSVLEGLRLRCYWDNSSTPQIECTLGSFFGSSLGLFPVAGLPLGIAGNEFYCYIPMPFWSGARLDLYNPLIGTTVNVSYEIDYKTAPYPVESGYFCAAQTSYQSATAGQDMTLGQLSGHGQLAGMVVTLISTANPDFLHGDLRLYVDGMAQPAMQGTDFDGDFNAGNYFASNPFSRPVHGAPALQMGSTEKRVCAYRFFLGDMIPFGSHLSLRAEHGNRNSQAIEYSAVIYSFKRPEIALVLSDELDVGNAASEQTHAYSVQGGQISQTHYYAHPGSYDDQYFSDQGKVHFGTSSFTASIDPSNRGVRLVRRRDASIFPQAALISINGDSVGTWWDADYNYFKRWSESAFEIPASITQGLQQIQISAACRSSQGWTEYRYQVYSHVPPRVDNVAPTQVTNLAITQAEDGSKMELQWDQAEDDVGVAEYRIYRSAVPGVQPTESYLIGETPLSSFTDANLMPGTWYYYRVSAVDYSGNQGEASVETAQRTSSSYLFECELLPISGVSVGDALISQNMMGFGENWSNQSQLLLAADEIGDFVKLRLTLTEADTFDVAAYFGKGPNYGIVNLRMDEQPLGLPSDLYEPNVQRSPRLEFGWVYLTPGTHLLALEVAGRNSASTGYRIGADNVLLTSHYLLATPPSGNSPTPLEFQLHQNYPNPFNAATRVQFSLPEPGWATLAIYNLAGRHVVDLKNCWLPAGRHAATWETADMASGLYILILQQEGHSQARKMLLLK